MKNSVPENVPEPIGKLVTLIHCFDADLINDRVTGRSVACILLLINKRPIDTTPTSSLS